MNRVQRPSIRRAQASDAEAVAELFWRIRQASVPAIPMIVHPRDTVLPFVRDELLAPPQQMWVAEADGIVGFAVVSPGWLEHLYIDPQWQCAGLGSRFIDLAKDHSPDGLSLWVFQSNVRAVAFYRRHGFTEVAWTNGDNDEGMPDARMVWPGRRHG